MDGPISWEVRRSRSTDNQTGPVRKHRAGGIKAATANAASAQTDETTKQKGIKEMSTYTIHEHWDTEDSSTLYDYQTGEAIRPATAAELAASIEAAEHDGGAGVIIIDGRSCYVQE